MFTGLIHFKNIFLKIMVTRWNSKYPMLIEYKTSVNPPVSLQSVIPIWNSTVAVSIQGGDLLRNQLSFSHYYYYYYYYYFKVELHCEIHTECNISFNWTERTKKIYLAPDRSVYTTVSCLCNLKKDYWIFSEPV